MPVLKGSLAASILSIHQYHNITNVLGGMTAWEKGRFPDREIIFFKFSLIKNWLWRIPLI